MAAKHKTHEQHIAVFGESGSGKTVLVSSFYGGAQEQSFRIDNLYSVVAQDIGQGNRLHKNYLGMRDSNQVPEATQFAATSYTFDIRVKDRDRPQAHRRQPFDAMRAVWHDYPGEWFEQDASGPEEAKRRVETFRSLLGSDVALLLVDGQKLLDNEGQEERYLKSLFGNFRNGLLALKEDVLEDGKPLIRFPRVWVIALSKSDLMPHHNVFSFRDLLIEKSGDEISELKDALCEFVVGRDAMSVGEDFVLLSSADFETDRIQVDNRIGIDLILPIAAMLPLERNVYWANLKQTPAKLAETLLDNPQIINAAIAGIRGSKFAPLGIIANFIKPEGAARLAGEALREVNTKALKKQDYVSAVLTKFKIDLERAEERLTLIRRP